MKIVNLFSDNREGGKKKLMTDAFVRHARARENTMSSCSAGASAAAQAFSNILEAGECNAWPGQTCGVAQYSWSWLEGHAFGFVLERLVHERRQVSLAEAREDRLQPPTETKNK